MTFELPNLTALFAIFFAVAALAAAVAVGTLSTVLARNHAVRVRCHGSIFEYCGSLVLGH